MNISAFKCVLKYLTGGVGGVADYLLDALNEVLGKVDPEKKKTVQAALNVTDKVFSSLLAFKWLCPTKWQTAYSETIEAVTAVSMALSDLVVTKEELETIKSAFAGAVKAWKSDDGETEVGPEDLIHEDE